MQQLSKQRQRQDAGDDFARKLAERKQQGAAMMRDLILTFKNEQISKDELMRRVEEVRFQEQPPHPHPASQP